jgi:hypothetical protein
VSEGFGCPLGSDAKCPTREYESEPGGHHGDCRRNENPDHNEVHVRDLDTIMNRDLPSP